MQALVGANGVSIIGGDGAVSTSEDEGVSQNPNLRRKRKRNKAAETPDSKNLVDGASARISDGEGKEGASESKEAVRSSCHKREAEAIDGSSDSSGSSTNDGEELSDAEDESEYEDGEKQTNESTAFGRAFQKIMKKKLPSSVLTEAMVAPICLTIRLVKACL
ncbi:hypothetical protein L7F22_002570 [Adiantum nelumboides]|nr:hypothetical protein [Adiantum nelumboides]